MRFVQLLVSRFSHGSGAAQGLAPGLARKLIVNVYYEAGMQLTAVNVAPSWWVSPTVDVHLGAISWWEESIDWRQVLNPPGHPSRHFFEPFLFHRVF